MEEHSSSMFLQMSKVQWLLINTHMWMSTTPDKFGECLKIPKLDWVRAFVSYAPKEGKGMDEWADCLRLLYIHNRTLATTTTKLATRNTMIKCNTAGKDIHFQTITQSHIWDCPHVKVNSHQFLSYRLIFRPQEHVIISVSTSINILISRATELSCFSIRVNV